MKCRNCSTQLERVDTYEMHHNECGLMDQCTPSAIYSCPECVSEYKWIRGRKLETVYDSYRNEYGFEQEGFNYEPDCTCQAGKVDAGCYWHGDGEEDE